MSNKSGEVGGMMGRNNPVGGSKSAPDTYRQWLIVKGAVGANGSNTRTLEKSFFAANGGTGKTYSELMNSFCAAKGITGSRTPRDNWRRFMASGTV